MTAVLLFSVVACGNSSTTNSTDSSTTQNPALRSFLEGKFSNFFQTTTGYLKYDKDYEQVLWVNDDTQLRNFLTEDLAIKEADGFDNAAYGVGYFSAVDYMKKDYATCYVIFHSLGEMDVDNYFAFNGAYDEFYSRSFTPIDKPEMAEYNCKQYNSVRYSGFMSEAIQQKNSYFNDLISSITYSFVKYYRFFLEETEYKQNMTISGVDGILKIGKMSYLTRIEVENDPGYIGATKTIFDVPSEDYCAVFSFAEGENTYCVSTYLAQRVTLTDEEYFAANVFNVSKPIIEYFLNRLK